MRVGPTSWPDRAPNMPLIGFLIGLGLSLLLWAIVGWGAWVLVA
jgi:hypothetical protein